MEEVKYIPGDLVTNHRDTVLRIVDMVKGMFYTEYQDGTPGLYISRKDIVPIPLTPQILETNGWLKIEDKFYTGYQHPKDWRLQIQTTKGRCVAYLHDEMLFEIDSVHELQHLLFGLGLPSNLKV